MLEHSQLEDLKKQHADLSRMVELEQQKPGADYLTLTELKKKKLKVKEEIHRLSAA